MHYPWQEHFSYCDDPWTGYVSQSHQLQCLLKAFSESMATEFVRYGAKPSDDRIDFMDVKHKVMWESNPDKGPVVPFCGQPFIVSCSWMFDCEFGCKRNKTRFKPDITDDGTDHNYVQGQRKRTRRSKKVKCGARVYVKKVFLFHDKAFSLPSTADYVKLKGKRDYISRKLTKQMSTDSEILIELRFYVKLPTWDDHSGHEVYEHRLFDQAEYEVIEVGETLTVTSEQPCEGAEFLAAEEKSDLFDECFTEENEMAESKLSVGAPCDRPEEFVEISFEFARKEFVSSEYWHAAHAMFFAHEPDRMLWANRSNLNLKAAARIMMQSRFDGNMGFPGGLMDKGPSETPVEALNRELVEEINLDLSRFACKQEDLLITHVNHSKKLVTYFYAKELTLSEFSEVERSVLDAEEWGTETFGLLRVPLFTMSDGYRGLPVFLANKFAGNARMQLLMGIQAKNILSEAEVNTAYKKHVELQQKEGDVYKFDD